MPREHVEVYRSGAHAPGSMDSYYEEYDRYPRSSKHAMQPYQQSHHSRESRPTRSDYSEYSPSDYSRSRRQRPVARRRSDSYLSQQNPSKKEKGEAFFKDHGAELAGAAVGGWAGHRNGDALKSASGAAVGAIGAMVVERQYKKWSDKKEDKKVGREVRGERGERWDVDSGSSYRGESRARYRSESRGRYRSESRGRAGREREKTPHGLKDLGRQIKRSLSRKGGRRRSESYDSEY